MTTRLRRILTVTAGLVGVGATLAAVAGAAVAALVARFDGELMLMGAMFGAPLGAILLPLAGWLLMRQVPLGRALVGTAIGTVAGGVVGCFSPIGNSIDAVIIRTLGGGVIGFLLAVLILRRSAPAPGREVST